MANWMIAVKSCHAAREKGYHQAIRDTWGKACLSIGVDLQFFMGKHPEDKEVELASNETVMEDVEDDYDSLPYKTKGILERFVGRPMKSFVFLCDTDTYLIPGLLAFTGFEKYDYFGRFGATPPGKTFPYKCGRNIRIEECYPWASGGVGYFLSQKAAREVIMHEPDHWAEDLWVGQILGRAEKKGYITIAEGGYEVSAAWHWHKSKEFPFYDVRWMHKMYKENP